nr:unnamed protein product [Naegleria fowleri]
MKEPDWINKTSSMCLLGNLVEPNSITASSGLDLEKFFVKVVNLSQWVFGLDSDCQGIWVESDKYWYKLLQPSTEYQSLFAPFERRCNLWILLRKYLSEWVDMLHDSKESGSNLDQKIKSLTLNKVLEEIEKNNFTEADLINNASFIAEKINEDENEFTLDDTNAALLPPFLSELLDRANKGPIIDNEDTTYESDDYEDFKIVIDDVDSDEELEEDSDYRQEVEESDETDNSENEDETFEPETKKQKQFKSKQQQNGGKTTKNNRETPKKKKIEDSESERKGSKKRKKISRKQKFSTEFKPPSWLPTMDDLLSEEFTPDLFRLLTTKYEDGVEPSPCRECLKRRIACTKERPLCGNCLEAGTRCNYPSLLECSQRKTECFYLSHKDRFLIIAEKRIQQARRKYAQEHPHEQPEYEIESDDIEYWKMQVELEKEESAKLKSKVEELSKELEKYNHSKAEEKEKSATLESNENENEIMDSTS